MRTRTALLLFAWLVAFFALLQVLGWTLGAAGVAWRGATAVVLTAAAALLSGVFAAGFRSGDDLQDEPLKESMSGPWTWWPRLAALTAGAWCLAVHVRLWLLAWRRPVYDWDGLYYHVPAIHEWVRRGGIGWLETPPDIPFVNYPMGVEATTFLAHGLHGSSALVNALNLWYWPLAVLALVVLAQRLGARDAWPWLAGALWAGAPIVVSQSATAYTDVGAAATVIAALAATLLLVFPASGSRLRRAALWGAALGLMAGAKGSGLPAAVIVVAGTLLTVGLRERNRWRPWAAPLLVGLGVALLVGGYWYVRAVWHTGNPVHPVQVAIGHNVIFAGYDHVAFSAANMPDWLAAHPSWQRAFVAWLQTDAPVSGAQPVGGLGNLWLAAGLPAAVLWTVRLAWRRRWDSAAPFALLAGLVLVLFAAQTANWWSRFTVWLVALGLPALVVLLQWAFSASGRAVARLAVLMVAAICIALPWWETGRTLRLEEADMRQVTDSGAITYPTSLQRVTYRMDEVPGFDRFWAADRIARTHWGRFGTLLGGTLSLPLGRRDIRVLPSQPSRADLEILAADGVSWLVWDEDFAGTFPAEWSDLVAEQLRHQAGNGPATLFLRLR